MKFSYETDFYGWTENQASLLRAGRFGEIDREHLIEEIESMGRSERAELENRLAVLLARLLKWRHQPVLRSRGWQLTITEQRRQIARLLRRNPSLQYRVAESLEEAYGDALILAEKETGLDSFPTVCPFDWEQLQDMEFLPQ